MDQFSLGVIARSRKDNEQRLAIHPLHVERIGPACGGVSTLSVVMVSGSACRTGTWRMMSLACDRDQLLADCDVIFIPEPLPQDLAEMREGQVLWGWPHCVQNEDITQLGIDRRLTLIAFEAMNHWSDDGSFNLHVFHKNNELAGYCSVLHAMPARGDHR